jgi:hypothetical protein
MIAVAIDLNVAFWGAWVGVHLGLDFWPSLAGASLVYTVLATTFTGRSFGRQWLAGSFEWSGRYPRPGGSSPRARTAPDFLISSRSLA